MHVYKIKRQLKNLQKRELVGTRNMIFLLALFLYFMPYGYQITFKTAHFFFFINQQSL